jgi:hypothetical protein
MTSPEKSGERGRIRTCDPCLKRALLYQLSYAPNYSANCKTNMQVKSRQLPRLRDRTSACILAEALLYGNKNSGFSVKRTGMGTGAFHLHGHLALDCPQRCEQR